MHRRVGAVNSARMVAAWSGQWVTDRLDLRLTASEHLAGVNLNDLVGLALRRNPRRAHLLVSSVLGKHVPTDPDLVYGSGVLLGVLVGHVLARAEASDAAGGRLLAAALRGEPGAARALTAHCARQEPLTLAPTGTVVLGYAETATALGQTVADQLRVPYMHSTRRPVPGVAPVGSFEEEHSHSTSHLLLPEDPDLLAGDGPLVLVDDELSTGSTALNTIAALHRGNPRSRYVIAALVDLRSDDDRAHMCAVAAELGTRIDAVALAAGRVALPPDVLARGNAMVETLEATSASESESTRRDCAFMGATLRLWPENAKDGGRHGFTPADRAALEAGLPHVAACTAPHVIGPRIHVLGTEELMYAPLRIAQALARVLPDQQVTYSTTTRSPVLALDEEGYAIRTALAFPAHDDPADGPGPRFAYNVAATATGDRFDTVVLVVDSPADTEALHANGGLLDQLRSCCQRVILLIIPDYRPAPHSAPCEPTAQTPIGAIL